MPLGHLRGKQKGIRITAPVDGNQEAIGHPGGQPKVPTSKMHRETKQQNEKIERRLLFLITAGTVCQTGSYSWYSWCVAMLTLLATGTQAQGPDKIQDINDMPADEMIIVQEALSSKTPESRGTPVQSPQ